MIVRLLLNIKEFVKSSAQKIYCILDYNITINAHPGKSSGLKFIRTNPIYSDICIQANPKKVYISFDANQ